VPDKNTVFVVDDDIAVLQSLKRLLNASGFYAEVFESAEAFCESAIPEHGLCVVLDVNLKATCGIELRRLLAASGSTLPVIFITANDSEHVRRTAIDAGCVAYLQKPFAAKLLFDAIHRAASAPAQQLARGPLTRRSA
jgi:FixJ family two-component response regulator